MTTPDATSVPAMTYAAIVGVFVYIFVGIVILQSRRVLRCNRKVEEIFKMK